jgi:hypothetical protein
MLLFRRALRRHPRCGPARGHETRDEERRRRLRQLWRCRLAAAAATTETERDVVMVVTGLRWHRVPVVLHGEVVRTAFLFDSGTRRKKHVR